MQELNESQLNNLKIFLNRVQLTGAEVGAFNELIIVLFAQPVLPQPQINKEEDKKTK